MQIAQIPAADVVATVHRDRPPEAAQRVDELTVSAAHVERRSRWKTPQSRGDGAILLLKKIRARLASEPPRIVSRGSFDIGSRVRDGA
jgi:hypothetical protein